jgi:hypothetical protein
LNKNVWQRKESKMINLVNVDEGILRDVLWNQFAISNLEIIIENNKFDEFKLLLQNLYLKPLDFRKINKLLAKKSDFIFEVLDIKTD